MKSNQIQAIKLTDIDPEAISAANLRKITEDEQFKLLCEQIKNAGQRNPIIVRELRVGESNQSETKYGILDGHHRFSALKCLEYETIDVIEIETEDATDELVNAAFYNMNHKELNSWEKRKILVELEELTDEKLEDIAARYFSIARSTAFKYKKAYCLIPTL